MDQSCEWDSDFLLTDTLGSVVVSVPLKPGIGKIARGRILKRTSNGMYVSAGTDDIAADRFIAILDEAVDTDADMLKAKEARAYLAGHFDEVKLNISNGIKLTEQQKKTLGQMGIFCEPCLRLTWFHHVKLTRNAFRGCALYTAEHGEFGVGSQLISGWYTDENDNLLMDENNVLLTTEG